MESIVNHEENRMGTGGGITPSRPLSDRKFGTKLPLNAINTPNSHRSSAKKLVKVRRTPNRSTPSFGSSTTITSSVNKTIIFTPGPVGLQLEPIKEDPRHGCRVVRFVDGGPRNPGQARKTGKIKPGDLVIQVEANGVISTAYNDIIQSLKDPGTTRTITLRSVWEPSFLDTQSKLNLQFPEELNSSARQETEKYSTPNRNNLTSAKKQKRKEEPLLPPPFSVTERERLREILMDITLIQSPSHTALLPHVRTQPNISSNGSRKDEDFQSQGPMIVHFNTPSPPRALQIAGTPREFDLEFVSSPSPPNAKEKEIDTTAIVSAHDTTSIPSVSTQPSNASARENSPSRNSIEYAMAIPFSPSGVKKISKEFRREGKKQVMLSRVFGTVYNRVAPIVAKSSYVVGSVGSAVITPVTNKFGEVLANESISQETNEESEVNKSQVLQELSCVKIAMDVQDEFERNMDVLARENESLKVEFEEKIKEARAQYEEAERKLKELYAKTCQQQEIRIEDLEYSNSKLKEELKKNYCTDSDDIGSKSLTSSSIETRNSFQLHGVLGLERSQLTTEYEELASIQSTEKDLRTKVSSLHHENKIIQEQKEGLQMELEMSHTMISEMEQRLMQFEASKANSTQQLMESLQDKDTELVDQKNRVSNLTNERVDLFERIDDLEKHLQDSQWTREELRKDLERAKMELIEAKDEVTCMHESVLHRLENGETRARAEAEINKIETEARKLTRELKASNEICEYLESSFRACRSTLLATFFQCESLKREKNSASHRVDQLKMRVLELSTSATEKETELDTKNGTLSLLDAKKVDLQESIKKLEMEFKSQDCGLDCPTKAQSSSAVLCLHTELFQEKLRQAQDELVETGLLREKLLSLHEEKASSEKTQSECISDPQIKQENDKLKTLLEFSRKAEVGYGVRIASLEAELSTTAEELARESLDLSRLKEVIDADQAFLFEAEEDLYQAVDIIKTLESNIATKKKAILTSKFRIDELIESEEVLAAENVCLYEKLLCLEGKVTSSSKLICDMRRSVASLESEKTALQTDLKNTGIESDEIDSVRSKLIEVSRGLKRAEIRAEQFEFTNMILESDMASLLDTMEKETSITHVEANRRERELKNNASLLRESLQEAIRKHLNVQETLREVKKRHDCEIETLEKSKSMVQSLLDEKQQQNDRLTMDFSAVVDEKNILRSTMVELEKSLTKKQVEFDDSLLSSQNQVETFKAKIGIIETERDSIQHKLTTVRSLVESKTKMQEKLEMDHQRHLADLQKNFLLLKAEYIAKHLKCIEFEKVVTDKDEDVLSLEIEISILQETLKEKGSEHRSEIAKFENRSNKMRIQAEKREEQIEKLLKVNYTASTELSDARRVLAERDASQAKNQSTFEEEKKMLLREKEQLTEQLFDLQRRNDQMKHILECLGKERETTQSKLQMAQKDFEHCLKDAQAKRCWSLAAAEALKRNLSKIDGEKKSLVNELEERALDNLKFVNVLQVANEMHQRNIVRLEFTNETLQSLADKRQEEIEKLAYEVSDASAEIDTLRESASSLDTLLRERQHSLETEKDRLNRDSSILREDLKSTNDQLLASKKEVGQLTQLLFNVETERDTLQCTLMAAQECAKVCDRKGRELAVEKANLEESIRRQHEELRQLREARCIGEAAREGLERAYNQLESQTDDLTANVKMKCTEIAFLSCNIDTVKSESKSFEKKVIFFKGLAHEKENENDKLREALEENREKHVEDSNDLKNNLEALTQKLLNAEEVIEQTNRSIQNINQERDSKHHDLELCRITLKQLIQEKSGFEASHRSQQEELRHARRGRCIEEAAREGLRRCCSCNTDNQRLLSCMEENTETANCGTETEEPHDDNSRIDGMGSFPGSNLNSLHLFSYKSAFQNQKEVLANVMASECLLTDFMKEVTNLGHGANAEIVELLRLLKYCEIPKREMLALDLASIQPSHEYIQGVCSRLDHLRQLAEEACSELGTRQRDFKKWQQARAQPPKTPITPRDLIKKESPGKDSIIDMVSLLNDRLLTPFEKNDFRLENCDSLRRSLATTLLHHNENTQRAKITGNNLGDGIARKLNLSIGTPNVEKGAIQTKENVRTKLAGARLLSSNLERRSMSQRASAFRKWSRASGAMKATSHQKEASVELSLQLENTRKKLVVLKSHLNLRKGRRQVSNSDKKPRLQMLLNAVTEQKRSSSDSFEV